jgi:hypothetical protein
VSDADDFYLLVPEDEWVEERLRQPRSWDTPDVIEAVHRRADAQDEGDLPRWWWNAWTAVGLALWVVLCVWAGLPTEVGGFGAAMFLWLRWRARRRETPG